MITVTIAGSNRTNFVVLTSLRIENILTQQVDRCSFITRSYGSTQFTPHAGRVVTVVNNGTTVFGGLIVKVEQITSAENIIEYQVECVDYTRVLDQHLIAETYEDMTVDEIIADIVANWAPTGITATQVDAPINIDFIQFNYEPVSSALKQLADIIGYDWYIDYSKDIYFKAPTATDASISLTDTPNGEYDQDSLVIRNDNSQIRNSIVVRGGEYLGTQFTASARFSDPNAITFLLPYKFTDFRLRVNGVNQDLGIDYIDDPDLFDALYNFNEKLVRWRQNSKPALDATLSFSGKPHLPVIVKFKSQALINSMFSAEGVGDGKYEYLVIDKSINSRDGARARALAEIQTYGETLSEGEFTTETNGLRAGQRILINKPSRGINNQYYVINKVISTIKTPTEMRYSVSLVTTRTMDYIAVLKKILLQETKKLEITTDEILDLVESADETLQVSDSILVQALNYAVVFRLGPQAISGTIRPFIVEGSPLNQ